MQMLKIPIYPRFRLNNPFMKPFFSAAGGGGGFDEDVVSEACGGLGFSFVKEKSSPYFFL